MKHDNKILLLGMVFFGFLTLIWAVIASSFQSEILKLLYFVGGLASTTEGFAPFDRAEKTIECLSMGRTEQ